MNTNPHQKQRKRNTEPFNAEISPLEIATQGWRPTFREISTQKAIPRDVKLRREGIYHFKELIHTQPKEWLIKQFGPGKEYPVNISKLIKNIIWQIRTRIVTGKLPPTQGLLRGFWYSYIKPTLARADSLNHDVDQYSQMIKMFVRLVQYRNLMRYKDMGFVDDNENDRKIGINNHIILFAEKAGHFPLLKRIAEQTEVTILSLGGQPSLLSAEYFVDEIKQQKIDIRKSFYTFSLVDYDTSGWIIRDAFLDDLRFYGVKHLQHKDLILPNIFTQEEIHLKKYPLPTPPEMEQKNKRWLKESGGIDGKLYGLEVDAAPTQRIQELFTSEIKDLIESTEDIRKGRALLLLSKAIEEYILAKLQTEET
ncbi:MAG: hypothetical protein L6300_09290 [Syntrophaceae bacterium]|nr:hypothetical protein [Syntrophaceae bacterium]